VSAVEPIGPGAFVAVVGASGVGKDAVLGWAREHAGAAARFPRRAITRPSGPGEDHDPVDPSAFAAARDAGGYAVHWEAHGLAYGIPVGADDEVRAGRVVVANVSRGVLETLAERYARLVVVEVTVSDAVRAERLGLRARESADGIARRLARTDPAPGHRVDVVIENDGALADAGARLLAVVEELAAQPAR
jgi:ribose 1,5-bisphosphokinase